MSDEICFVADQFSMPASHLRPISGRWWRKPSAVSQSCCQRAPACGRSVPVALLTLSTKRQLGPRQRRRPVRRLTSVSGQSVNSRSRRGSSEDENQQADSAFRWD